MDLAVWLNHHESRVDRAAVVAEDAGTQNQGECVVCAECMEHEVEQPDSSKLHFVLETTLLK
jgi:hypothetical protein